MANLTLGQLIGWLSERDPTAEVEHGFSTPHSDRGNYSDLAFTPERKTTMGAMLAHAESALGKTFTGYKGGEYVMGEWTDVLIGEWGECGENITDAHLCYWNTRPAQTEDEVLAAAKRMYSALVRYLPWEKLPKETQNRYLRMARAALGVG